MVGLPGVEPGTPRLGIGKEMGVLLKKVVKMSKGV
jgi:hypothetical protein